MTQLELAEKMGVTDKAVSKWERDLSYPDLNSIPKLAEIFGVSVEDLMQNRLESQREEMKDITPLVHMILKAIALAMGVSVVALSCMGSLEAETAVILLGIGLACAGAVMLEKP